MNAKHPDLKDVLTAPEAAGLLKNRQALEALVRSEEAQRLMELLNQNSGGTLKNAAQSAMAGDTAQLMSMVQGLMNDPRGAKLAGELNKKIK